MWTPQGIYADFLLRQPNIFFGKGGIRGLFNFPGYRIAVIHGRRMDGNISGQLQETFKKRSLRFIKKSWDGEPDLGGLKETIKELEIFQPDVILAVGGGSVIDGAKLCRVFYEFPYVDLEWGRIAQMEFKTSFLAIPTTIGSGAEASSAAVYYSQEEKRKKMVVCHGMQPEAVVLDPDAVTGNSQTLWYASALDALAHLIEGFVSAKNNGLAERMAVQGVRMIHDVLIKGNQITEDDILSLQYGGYIGGIVQNHCLVGIAHAIAHQLTFYGYTHSEAVALLLPQSIRINRKDSATAGKYDFLSNAAGFDCTDDLIGFLDDFAGKTGKDRKEMQKVLKSCKEDETFYKNVREDPGGKGNPLPITDTYISEFIEEFAQWNI